MRADARGGADEGGSAPGDLDVLCLTRCSWRVRSMRSREAGSANRSFELLILDGEFYRG